MKRNSLEIGDAVVNGNKKLLRKNKKSGTKKKAELFISSAFKFRICNSFQQ